jgi:hypothetical protein
MVARRSNGRQEGRTRRMRDTNSRLLTSSGACGLINTIFVSKAANCDLNGNRGISLRSGISVAGRGGVPHYRHTRTGILCLCRFLDTCQPRDARGHGHAGSVASCIGRRDCGGPRAVGDFRNGFGFDGAWRVVAGRGAFRAAHPNSEAAGVTACPKDSSPCAFRGLLRAYLDSKSGWKRIGLGG